MQIPKALVDKVKQGDCILFLGSGVHAPPPAGSPYLYDSEQSPPWSGGDLAERLVSECQLENYKDFEKDYIRDLQRVSLFIETTPSLERKTLVDALNKELCVGKKPSPALRMLAELPFKIIITTNFDLLLDEALKESKKKKIPYVLVYNPHLGSRAEDIKEDPTEERPLLFKMHGDLNNRDSIVITDEDYIKFIQRMSEKDEVYPVPPTIRYRMQKWNTLFIGYSLRGQN